MPARFDELNGYALDARAREVLAGLSFSQERMDGDGYRQFALKTPLASPVRGNALIVFDRHKIAVADAASGCAVHGEFGKRVVRVGKFRSKWSFVTQAIRRLDHVDYGHGGQ